MHTHPSPLPHPSNTATQEEQEDPDKALAIVSLGILMMLPLPPVSFILAYIALRQSKQRGYKNTLAKASLIVNAVLTVILLPLLAVWLYFSVHTK
jgi:heme/copper-type cytochrome/quinol oxidase subunit 1